MEKTLNVNEEQTAPVQSAETQSAAPEQNVNKLYNLISLILACVMLAAEIFVFASLSSGLIYVNGIVFNAAGLTDFLNLVKISGMSLNLLPNLIAISCFSVFYLVVFILLVIGLIKSIIGIFGFFKLKKEYSVARTKILKYGKTVSRSYACALSFIAASFLTDTRLTGLATGVIVIASLLYVGLSAFSILYNENGFNTHWIDMAFELGRKLVMFMLAFLLVSGIKCEFLSCISNLIGENAVMFEDTLRNVGNIYYTLVREYVIIVPYAVAISAMVKIAGNYALNTGKKDVNFKLKKLFITIIVFAVLFGIVDCFMYKAYLDAGIGEMLVNAFFKNWFGLLLVGIAGTVLTQAYLSQLEKVD